MSIENRQKKYFHNLCVLDKRIELDVPIYAF